MNQFYLVPLKCRYILFVYLPLGASWETVGVRENNNKKSQKANAKLRKVFVIHIIKQGLIPLIEFLKGEITIHEENGQKIQADNSHKKK